MSYIGDSLMDCGYFYVPYIDLMQTPVVLDPNENYNESYGNERLPQGPDKVDWQKEGF